MRAAGKGQPGLTRNDITNLNMKHDRVLCLFDEVANLKLACWVITVRNIATCEICWEDIGSSYVLDHGLVTTNIRMHLLLDLQRSRLYRAFQIIEHMGGYQ